VPVGIDEDPHAAFAILTVTDPYTFDEWRAGAETVLELIVYSATAAVLIDRHGASPPSMDFVDGMLEFFQSHAAKLRNGRAAIVDPVTLDMSRVVELRSAGVPCLTMRVFGEYDGPPCG